MKDKGHRGAGPKGGKSGKPRNRNAWHAGDAPRREGRGPGKGFRNKDKDGAQGDRPRGDRPWKDKPREGGERSERPRFDKPRGERGERPWKDKPREDRGGSDRPRSDKPRGDRPYGDRPRGDRPWKDKPRADRTREDKPRSDRPYSDRPRGDRPWKDKPREDRERGDRPRYDKPRGERGDRPRSDRPWKDKPRDGRPPRKDFKKDFKKDSWREKRGPREDVPPLAGRANLWGTHAVTEAWLNPARKIKALMITEEALAEFGAVLARASELELDRPQPAMVQRISLDRGLERGAVHQGIAADAEPLEEIFLQDLVVRAQGKERAVIIILDQVTDPHNVGAVLRSASAFGAVGVIMQSRHAPEITGTMAKTACGAVEHVPVAYETNLSRSIEQLQQEGFTVIGLDERGEKTLAEMPIPDKAVIVLGAEGKGMRHNLREHCNVLVRLPTQGAILSLNVSNAAAVALYALMA